MDIYTQITRYESGELDIDETVELFENLIETGVIYSLQGSYQRMALFLVESGAIACNVVNR